MCSNIYDQTIWILHFLCGFGFLLTQNLKQNKKKTKKKIKCENNQNNAYKEIHDAQMHDNEASNA